MTRHTPCKSTPSPNVSCNSLEEGANSYVAWAARLRFDRRRLTTDPRSELDGHQIGQRPRIQRRAYPGAQSRVAAEVSNSESSLPSPWQLRY